MLSKFHNITAAGFKKNYKQLVVCNLELHGMPWQKFISVNKNTDQQTCVLFKKKEPI